MVGGVEVLLSRKTHITRMSATKGRVHCPGSTVTQGSTQTFTLMVSDEPVPPCGVGDNASLHR